MTSRNDVETTFILGLSLSIHHLDIGKMSCAHWVLRQRYYLYVCWGQICFMFCLK